MSILSASRRHRRSALLLRHLSSVTAPATAAADGGNPEGPPPISVAVAKTRLRREFDPDRAVAILSSIGDPSTSPASSRFAVDLAVRRLARARRFSEVESLLESRKSPPSGAPGCPGGALTEAYLATIILTYGTAHMIDHARRTFEDVPRLTGAPHSAVSLNAVLSACIKAKKPRIVPALFRELSAQHSVTPDAISYSILIKALCLDSRVNKALEVFKEMVETNGYAPTTVIYTTLLDALYKEKKPNDADKLWQEMVEKGCTPDAVAYNVRVMNLATSGKPEPVLQLIEEMEAAGVKPDTITYNYLITSYCNDGRFQEVKELYRGMRNKNCTPNATTFRILLARFCKNGDVEAAKEVYKDSLTASKIPDFRTMKLYVEELVKAGEVEEAKIVVKQMKQRFPQNSVQGWNKVEKDLGLSPGGQESDQVSRDGKEAETDQVLAS